MLFWLPINVEVLVNCQSAGSDQRNVLRAYRSPLPWPGRGEGKGRCSAIGSETLASWQLEFEPLTFILSPFFKRRGGPPTAPADNQRTLPNQRSHGCALARRRGARTGLGSARVPGAGCGVPPQRNSPEPLFPCKVISPKKSSRTPGDVRQHARGVRSPETWRDARVDAGAHESQVQNLRR